MKNVNKPNEAMRPSWRRIIFVNILAFIFCVLVLLYEYYLAKNFAWPHAVALATVLIALNIYYIFNVKSLFHKFADLTGLEGEFKVRSFYGLIIGILLSASFLLGGVTTSIPPLMQFQLVTVSATLGGLIIASSNFKDVPKERRVELLKVGQKLISATVSFIFFVGLFFFVSLSHVDPSKFEGGLDAIVRGIIFWFAVFFFFGGSSIFTMGIIDLVVALKNLKHEVTNSK